MIAKIINIAHLVDSFHYCSHGGVAGPVHGPAVVSRPPGGAVDLDQLRLVAHGVGLYQIRHVRLIQHTQSLNGEEGKMLPVFNVKVKF